ncbi:MAG: VOC family protein [Candidatus Acidiferrum sp.]|jgi:catechol 2,3-dioxygenase-like lactoylglutathione lyase family enzyme
MLDQQKLTAFVAITDYETSRAFYEGILGLKFLSQDNFAMVLEGNGTKIRMAKVPNLQPAPFTVLGWEVGNVETMVGDLQSRGVQFERYPFMPEDGPPIWTAPGGDKVAWFKDPSGNVLSLAQHARATAREGTGC